jgi:hypothetical protein
MLIYEYILSLYPYFSFHEVAKTEFTESPNSYSIDIDLDRISSNEEYEIKIEEATGVHIPASKMRKLPAMSNDGTIQTPNGIRYKIINTKTKPSIKYIQYIQPDGNYALSGEAVKLPNGKFYNGKNGMILQQQEPNVFINEEFSIIADKEEIELQFLTSDTLDFDFGYIF